MAAPALNLARRAGWNIVDQVLSTLSNVALSVIVAKSVDRNAFGAFATAFLIFALLIAFNRAAVGQPLNISFSGAHPEQYRTQARSALGAAVVVGVIAGALTSMAGLLLQGQVGRALVAVAVCMPVLLLQDTCRIAFFGAGRADKAALNDFVWTAIEMLGLSLFLLRGVSRVDVAILVWGGSAALAALFGLWQLGYTPDVRAGPAWAWRQRHLTGYLVAEYVLGQGSVTVGTLVVGTIGGARGVGSLRGAQVLLGPPSILGAAAFMFAVPEIARRPHLTGRQRTLSAIGLSAAMWLVTAGYVSVLLLLPTGVGEALLGDTWNGAQTLLVPMSIFSMCAVLATGPAALLYGMGHARVTFRINIIKAPLMATAMASGVWLDGPSGAVWGMALVEGLTLPLWCYRLYQLR